jgi:hypothetical protein
VDTWEVIRVEIARPAASSFAELMRRPVDRRSIEVAIARSLVPIAFRAIVAPMFVFITVIRVSF